jgi:hypothetical protein
VIIQANIEAERDISYVYVSRIAIKIAVRDTKRKLASPDRVTIINREKPSWSTFWTARAH